MKLPNYINSQYFDRVVKDLPEWHALLDKIHDEAKNLGTVLSKARDRSDMRHAVTGELLLAQFFTFNSIRILVQAAHFADAYSLLRVLYEAHLHLWNLTFGPQEDLERFVHLGNIQDWRITNEALQVPGADFTHTGLTPERLARMRQQYDSAIVYFNARPGKIPRNYTTTAPETFAREIDEAENSGRPFRQLMHVRLYSAGSEYIHRSLFGIREGYAAIQDVTEAGGYTLAPNPDRGIECSWWASHIMLDCVDWQFKLLDQETPTTMEDLRTETRKLAVKWLQPSTDSGISVTLPWVKHKPPD